MNIKQAAQTAHLPADTLRYWERVGVIPPVHRASSGYREYTDEDLGWVNFALCMRQAGVSIEALIEYIALYQQGSQTEAARKQLLVDQLAAIDEKLAGIQATRQKLVTKIAHYSEGLDPFNEEEKAHV